MKQFFTKLPRHIICLILSFYTASSYVLAQTVILPNSSQARNIDLCDSLLRFSVQGLQKQLRTPLFPQDTLYVSLVQHESSWLLEQYLFKEIPRSKRFRASDSLKALSRLNLRITDLTTRYFACADKFDNLSREISCALAATVESNQGMVQPLDPISFLLRDTISRQSVSQLESKQYSFAQATVPEAAPNFWKQILEPAIVILSGALIIALFFLVRTQ